MKLAAVLLCGVCLHADDVTSNVNTLWRAAYRGNLETVRAELAEGADVNDALETDVTPRESGHDPLTTGATPLMAALSGGHPDGEYPDIVKTLVAHGADLARGDDQGWTPMHCAVGVYDETFEAFVEAMLARAVDPQALVNVAAPGRFGTTPLHRAVISGSKRMVRWLLDMGADLAAPVAENTPLVNTMLLPYMLMTWTFKDMFAGIRMIDILLDGGLHVDTPGRSGRTALGLACGIERSDYIGLLVSRGADPARGMTDCEPHL